MTNQVKYAVVDLETTGSNYKQSDRIIQFACTFVEGNQIVDTIEMKINPDRKIPYKIELLTGISNDMVATCPYFFELADSIKHLLEGYVFVAHNVKFDLNFLNHELQQAGLSALSNHAIDTVAISRIVFPQLKSYSLQALNESLDLGLVQAHDAGQDAQATARLLLKCIKKLGAIPNTTLDQIVRLTQQLPYHSWEFFANGRDHVEDQLDSDYIYLDRMVVRAKLPRPGKIQSAKTYPSTFAGKRALFKDKYEIRPYQVDMMDTIYDHGKKQSKSHLGFEAAPGSGKSLGYLFPAAYISQNRGPVVISTYSILLQNQLIEKDITALNAVLDHPLSVAILKSQFHYVDLQSVDDFLSIKDIDSSQALFLSQILVWLTETDSGDLDEVVTTNQSHPFWQEIRSTRAQSLIEQGPWSDIDFFLNSRRQADQADIIVTNHAYISQASTQNDECLKQAAYIIIDEAHHFIDQLMQASTLHFSFQSLTHYLSKAREKLADDGQNLKKSLDQSWQVRYDGFWSSLDQSCLELTAKAQEIISQWIQKLGLNQLDFYQSYDQRVDLRQVPQRLKDQMNDFTQLFHHLYDQLGAVVGLLLDRYSGLDQDSREIVDRFYSVYLKVDDYFQSFKSIFSSSIDSSQSYSWLKKFSKQDSQHFYIYQFNHDFYDQRLEDLFSQPAIAYVTSDSQALKRVYQQKGKANLLKLHHLTPPFDYGRQTAVVLPKDLVGVKELDEWDYEKMVAYYLNLILSQSQQASLVLFNSLASLQGVYDILQQLPLAHQRPILAQGVHGNKHRLIKKFKKLNQPVLLGAHSFWEGIDLAFDDLSLVVVTRLPFDSPDNVWHHIRMQSLDISQQESFYALSLPRAVHKLKQAFGRLTRGPDDRGMMVVLDDRFIHSSYAKQLQQAIPPSTALYQLTDQQLGHLDRFFNKR